MHHRPPLPGLFWRGLAWVALVWAIAFALTALIVMGLAQGVVR